MSSRRNHHDRTMTYVFVNYITMQNIYQKSYQHQLYEESDDLNEGKIIQILFQV